MKGQAGALALALILVLGLGAFILFSSLTPVEEDQGLIEEAYADAFLTVLTSSRVLYSPDGREACPVDISSLLAQYMKRPHAKMRCGSEEVEIGQLAEDVIAMLVQTMLLENGLAGKYRFTICHAYQPDQCMQLYVDANHEKPLLGDFCVGKNLRKVREVHIRQAVITFALCP